ncbi:MAG: nucleotidyltransferase domain-containing protein [Phycisphaerales bacterium]|nr:nucleotidyltransferase domain-containing protein [Phycisphaerales bacterium]
MKEQLLQHRGELAELSRRFGVRRLEVFGSATGSEFDAQRSDIDFLVEFHPSVPRTHYESYFGLLEALGRLFERPIDFVEPQTVRNAAMKRRMEESRTLLFAA